MKPFRLIEDWQAKFFGLAPAPPRRDPPSDAFQAWQAEDAVREQAWLAELRAETRHLKALAETETVAKWRPLVERFGADAITAICRRTDATFELPSALRNIQPSHEEK